jgi:signal transduction histidine kinase
MMSMDPVPGAGEVGTLAAARDGMRLCALLRARRERILLEWEQAVRRSASQSAALSRDDLLDDIPRFIDRLIEWLDDGSSDSDAAVDHDATSKHARHRLQFAVELRHLIHEYRLLRQILLAHAREAQFHDAGELFGELGRLDDAIDHAMIETIATYTSERDAARDLVLGIIGHDLRNPLSTVAMASSALCAANSVDEARSAGARIKRSAGLMQRMISDLLDLTRSRFGVEMPARPELFDFGEVARATVDEMRIAHPDRGVRFAARGELVGSWDRVRIAQLVSNLVGNAIQHGRDPIDVSVEGAPADVILRVANHGSPIEEAALATLFEPFHRSGKDDDSNLGLGLFIVSEIVRRHAGTIDVRSTAEETVFTVRLPRRPSLD